MNNDALIGYSGFIGSNLINQREFSFLFNSKNISDIKYKTFWGSASSSQSGKENRIEGIKMRIPYKKESIFVKLKQIEESLQSAISYAGGNPAILDSLMSVDYVVVK